VTLDSGIREAQYVQNVVTVASLFVVEFVVDSEKKNHLSNSEKK
jgi:hypothetical protein